MKSRNAGTGPAEYSLNIGAWRPEGSPPPAARFIRQLPLPGDIHVDDVGPVVFAKKRAKKRAGGAKKRAKRRR